jgi:hypothetical protein
LLTPGSKALPEATVAPFWVNVAMRGGCKVKVVLFVRVATGVDPFPVSFNWTVKGKAVAVVTAWVMSLVASRVSEGDSTCAVQTEFKLFPALLKVAGSVPALMHHL